MPSFACISVEKLERLTGTPNCPAILDVRTEVDFAGDPRLIPGSSRRAFGPNEDWLEDFGGRAVVVVCHKGHAVSQGVAAILRQRGVGAQTLEGGHLAWASAGMPLVPVDRLPRRALGRTQWVTRERPKVDRIACPWLIRRFVDPKASFLFVAAGDVMGVAEKFAATPFDVEGVAWSHRGERCTFDVMVEEFGLATPPLLRLAAIVRGADTSRHDLAPEAAGLLAASLGLSRMHADDHDQLEAGMGLYDAFYRWCRDATGETHNWPARGGKSK